MICLRQSLNLQLTVSLDTDNIHNKLTKVQKFTADLFENYSNVDSSSCLKYPDNNTANGDNNFNVIDTSSEESQQKSHDENEEQEPLSECSMNVFMSVIADLHVMP
jgi:hypothetical protein